jgi:hypothetical protein
MSASTDAVTQILAHDPARAKALGLTPPAATPNAAAEAAAAAAKAAADTNALAAYVAYSAIASPFERARMRFVAGSEIIERGRELVAKKESK